VWASVTNLYGEVGASLTGLTLIDFDIERKLAVVRASLITLNTLKASIATINSIAGKDAAVHVLAISGTLKALYANKKRIF
jgi:RNase P/RNase MRP subunit POP5